MPRRKYNAAQQAELDLLADLHLEKVRSRAVIRARIEAELRDALNDLELKESRQANACLAAKISKTDIGRALGTANFQTIRDTLARTALDLTPEDFDPMSKVVSFDEDRGMFTITMPGDSKAFPLNAEGRVQYEYGEDNGPTAESMPGQAWWAWWETVYTDITKFIEEHPHA